MAKMIQVRSVPDKLHRELVRRARKRGETLTQYIQHILEREVARQPIDELLERLARLPKIDRDKPVAEMIREARAERSAQLQRVFDENR